MSNAADKSRSYKAAPPFFPLLSLSSSQMDLMADSVPPLGLKLDYWSDNKP